MLRVLAPMVLTTFVILAVLRACDVSLNLFHLISLVLAAGLGLDYALFFEHAADDAAEQKRTLHALMVCALSTLLVFALLGAVDGAGAAGHRGHGVAGRDFQFRAGAAADARARALNDFADLLPHTGHRAHDRTRGALGCR